MSNPRSDLLAGAEAAVNGYWTYWEDMPRAERDLSIVVKS